MSRGKVKTIYTTREEMIQMIDMHFIQKAVTEEDYQDIWKVVKRGVLFDKILDSKDGSYQMRSKSKQGGCSLHRYIWIYDKNEDIFYEYRYYVGFYGKFKKTIQKMLEQAQKK